MEKVLLAINGICPDKRTFDYAVQLCERMKAELKVLLVIRPETGKDSLHKMRQKASKAKSYWEGAMMAAAFAEAGEHETANDLMDQAMANIKKLLPESEKAGIPCQLTVEEGEPERKIADYVKENRDVVITVYDDPAVGNKKSPGRTLQKILPIPVVMVQAAG